MPPSSVTEIADSLTGGLLHIMHYGSLLPYYAICFIPDTFTNYAQLSTTLCPMCTQRLLDSSDREGALSWSSNDTVDSEDVDSVSLGILPEL